MKKNKQNDECFKYELSASPHFIKIKNRKSDYQFLREHGLLLLPLISKEINDGILAEVLYRNIFVIEYFNTFGYDNELFHNILFKDIKVSLEDVKKNYLTEAYFYSDVYLSILEKHNENLFIVFQDWDLANCEIKRFMNEKIRTGTTISSYKLLFNIASKSDKSKFKRKDWATYCDYEIILFGHEIQILNLNQYQCE